MKNKNEALLLSSIFINNIGDVLFDMFIVWKITIYSGNIMNAVYILGSSIIFRALLSMFSGIIVDRFDKKKLMYFVNSISILIITFFAIVMNFALENIYLAITLILLNNINNEIFYRGTTVIGAEILDKNTFIKFQSFSGIIGEMINVLGSALIGFMIAFIPDIFIFVINIISFALSSLLLSKIHLAKIIAEAKQKSTKNMFSHVLSDIKVTVTYIYKSRYVRYFVIIMFILNLAYGFIPNILPIIISSETESSIYLGILKSSISIGGLLGLLMVYRYGNKVSLLFKTSMIGCSLCFFSMCFSNQIYIILSIFAIYGFCDSISQPLFSYTISSINDENRGKVMGGIDTLILLSPSIGMYIGTKVMGIDPYVGYIYLSLIFVVSLIIFCSIKELNHIEIKKDKNLVN